MFGRATIRLGIGPHSSFHPLSVPACTAVNGGNMDSAVMKKYINLAA